MRPDYCPMANEPCQSLCDKPCSAHRLKVATTPPQRTWVGLTDEEIGKLYRDGWSNNMEFARAIEDKLRSKNT